MSDVRVRRLNELSDTERHALLDRRPQSDLTVVRTCSQIIEAVRARGDDAVLEYTRTFDGVSLTLATLRVPAEAFEKAEEAAAPEVAEAIRRAMANIERFHRAQGVDGERWIEVERGVWCGERWTPVDSVCLYIPRGRGTFVSVACMLGIPARLAGVSRIVVCTPPGPDGLVDPATLYALRRLGIDEVYRAGGAQAVAAVAFGTETIPKCDKIVGPGNVYVSAARRLLADVLDPGSPAGPSESLILCDESADPRNAAWNLLIEAEHGENSTAVLVTHVRELAERVATVLREVLETLSPTRREYAHLVLRERGGILMTESLDDSIAFANRFAAEHVALMVADPATMHPRIRNAGEILFGSFPVISLANYAMGVNAILPTGGMGRSASALSLRDFQKVTSLGFCTQEGFARLKPVVSTLSRDEGFSAHHLAVEHWTTDVKKGSM